MPFFIIFEVPKSFGVETQEPDFFEKVDSFGLGIEFTSVGFSRVKAHFRHGANTRRRRACMLFVEWQAGFVECICRAKSGFVELHCQVAHNFVKWVRRVQHAVVVT